MINLCKGLILFSMILVAPSVAITQDVRDFESPGSAPVVAYDKQTTAGTCRGTVRGKRWYLTTSSPVTMAVIDVRPNGRVKRQTALNLIASSQAFGLRKIRGGKLFENPPVFKKGAPNRCFVSGRIKIAGGHTIDLFNAFIAEGNRMISGNCTIDVIHETLCTLISH